MLSILALTALSAPTLAGLQSVQLFTVPGNPVGYYAHPTNHSLAFVVLKAGQILTVKDDVVRNNKMLSIPVADLATNGERGLLGFAFHPNYATNHYAYAFFTRPNGDIQISRFTRKPTGTALDYATRYDILTIAHPNNNHNGGTIMFGPEGYLYISTGDGGSANDPPNNAQNTNVLLGKILRINVDKDNFASNTRNYAIPVGNPFRAVTGKKGEIWAYGLRNPWKFSFDVTGDILIGDVGQSLREEVDRIPPGASGLNFGWRAREGFLDNPNVTDGTPPNAVDPILDYDRTIGRCVTGGRVYRGSLLGAQYVGRYFFADYATSRIWSCDPYAANVPSTIVEHTSELLPAGAQIVSIDQTYDGELILVDLSGKIYKVEPAS